MGFGDNVINDWTYCYKVWKKVYLTEEEDAADSLAGYSQQHSKGDLVRLESLYLKTTFY